MRTGAILLAAGRSERMGENKMLFRVLGKTVLERSFEALVCCPAVDRLVLVASEETLSACQALATGADKPAKVILGGVRRQDSVLFGLRAIADCDIALIHDGARPFVTQAMLMESIRSAGEFGSGVAAIPVTDTIKFAPDGIVESTVDRTGLYRMQTPQTFRLKEILSAYEAHIGEDVTDDAALFSAAGHEVRLIPGSEDNIKLTLPEDLHRAQAIAAGREGGYTRVGFGEDYHQLVEGRKLVLGGVEIPFEKGLLGHSDADVITHAVMDALLGAAALGDIGTHFPDTDEACRGADSIALLKRVAELVEQAGFRVANIDATVIAQKPKLAPHIDRMRQNIAVALGIPKCAVAVKATTTEGMGEIGKGQGMAARAVALLCL
ncbi:MAG: 2-C-methyl-D-erythritol 2,4-cyclodiphosphate synthase [Christensenellales bacterium]|jgi:2-C-methyl-D-erythritol 4-phosphate cytidylyltransferase/2-C-methyl-D-erythritol 2,4-cyclodiphosphate synthase